MKLFGHFMTDRGQIRSTNEDAGGIFTNKSGQLLAIVADGMGGHLAGDVASELAVSFIKDVWERQTCFNEPEEAEKWIRKTIDDVNHHISERASANKEYEGMETTVVMSLCTKEFVTIAHIGDSRCYFLNKDNFHQVTDDHSLVNELVKTGQISETDAEKHPRKNVLLKAVGTEPEVHADIKTISWEANDRVLLCSDGLTNKINDAELEAQLRQTEELDEIVLPIQHH